MPHPISIYTDSGTIVFSDESAFEMQDKEVLKHIKTKAESEGFVVFDGEYEANLSFTLLINEETHPLEDAYEKAGGAFRLELPTGVLRVCEPDNLKSAQTIEIAPGTYAFTSSEMETGDLGNFIAHEKEAVGEKDWNYLEWVNRIGVVGCLTILMAVVFVIVPLTRQYWWIFLPLFLLPHGLMLLLQQTRRYKRADKKRADFQKQCPYMLLRLQKAEDLPEVIKGGVILPSNR